MSNSKKNSKIGNRNRVQLFRRVNLVLKNEIINDKESENIDIVNQNETNNSFYGRSEFLREKLKNWALEYRINRRALSALLRILILVGFSLLTPDSRTLLKTPRFVEITQMCGGKFWYNGLTKNIKQIFSKLNKNICIELNFNIDGLPLFKSSKFQFWPVLADINGNENCVCIIILPSAKAMYF